MVLDEPRTPLREADLPDPEPSAGQVQIRVSACAVCRTDLHLFDGELNDPKLPIVPGHQIVGTMVARGDGAERFAEGERVGVPWLGWACGECSYCTSGRENLCPSARFTGYTLDGGFAEYALADERFCFALPERYGDAEAAPLLCAGLIGYRSYAMAGEGKRLGLYGFGAAAHVLVQVARAQGREVYAFTRPGDSKAQAFARRLGAIWAGDSNAAPPEPLDAAILFAPAGELVPVALGRLDRGGTLAVAGIHLSEIPPLDYQRHLFEERTLTSVTANTRADGRALLELAAAIPIRTHTTLYPLERANDALDDLKNDRVRGAAVLEVASSEG
jgi:propanol-preferring alcohol dehydrogenase